MRYSLLFLLFIFSYSYGQTNFWKKSDVSDFTTLKGSDDIKLPLVFELDYVSFLNEIGLSDSIQIFLPNSKGEFDRYFLFEKKNTSNRLSAKFPNVRTFRGYDVSNLENRISVTLSSDRIYFQRFSYENEYIRDLGKNTFVFYHKGTNISYIPFSCGIVDEKITTTPISNKSSITSKSNNSFKNNIPGLRTLRLAVVTTGEYSEINGVTKEEVFSNIVSIVNNLNNISELELGIIYELVDNNDQLIFTDKSTDPFDIEGNGVKLSDIYLNQRTQIVIDSIIGKDNYDLGHLFIARNEDGDVPYGIGNAFGIGNVGTPEKGSGWSYFSSSTTNEFGFIGLVSHEFGHQLGATHTFSNQVDGQVTQSELSSGRSLMSYGIKNQSDLHYYHYHSINQIIESFKRTQWGIDFSSIGTFTPFTQQFPSNINLIPYYIPIRTPFVLSIPAELVSSNNSYNWEQLDSDIISPGSYWGAKSQTSPLFSSTSPSSNTKRYFPSYLRIIENNLTSGNDILDANQGSNMLFETLPEIPRQMTFGLSIRDLAFNRGVYLDSTQVFTVANSKPFSILTSLIAPVEAGSSLNVEWEISNTNDSPINLTEVNILLSIDGGDKFDYLLASKTSNDGSQTVVIPNVATTNARIKIEPVNNIFFTINPLDFEIIPTQLSLFSSATEVELTVCNEYKQTFNLQVQNNQDTSTLSDISFTGAPQGLTISLSKNQVAVNEAFTATISNESAAVGTYYITLNADLNGFKVERPIVLSILESNLTPVELLSPSSEGVYSQKTVELKWNKSADTKKVLLQISNDQNFSNLLIDKIIYGDSFDFTPPVNGIKYFWRVYALNECTTSESTSSSFSFDKGFEKSFAHNGDLYDTSEGIYPIQVTDSNLIKEMKVSVMVSKDLFRTNLKINEMTMSLISPSGHEVILATSMSKNTVVNLNSVFYLFEDQAQDFSAPFYNESTQTWLLSVSPEEALSQFIGENMYGEWMFKVEGKSDAIYIEEVSIEFLSNEIFKAPRAENVEVFLFQNENKISLVGKNFLGEELVNSMIEINKLPSYGTLVDSQNNLLLADMAYPITDVYFVQNEGFQGLDRFNYQIVDTDLNLKSITKQVIIDYKDIKPDLVIFDIYSSMTVGESKKLHLTAKNIEYYSNYEFNLSSPIYGTIEINDKTIEYFANSIGDEIIELTYSSGNVKRTSFIYISNFDNYNLIEKPNKKILRKSDGFRIGRTLAINADGTILASS